MDILSLIIIPILDLGYLGVDSDQVQTADYDTTGGDHC